MTFGPRPRWPMTTPAPPEGTAAGSPVASSSYQQRWIRRDRVLSRRLPDGWLLAAVDGSDDPVHLQGSASEIWDQLVTPRTVGDLAGMLLEQFDITEADATEAVESCVAALHRHQLIETSATLDADITPLVP